jgi:hypothetical protein
MAYSRTCYRAPGVKALIAVMRLEALTAGAGADQKSFSGTVHSAFARACNIEREGGALLGLVAREIGAVPRGFQLASPDGFCFLDHVMAGARAFCRGGLLRFEQSIFSVDLRLARPWRSRLADNPIDGNQRDIADAWGAAWAALGAQGGAIPIDRQAGDAIAVLFHATQTLRRDRARDAVSRLIGLGEGLTPAGDDFLIGFLAGLASVPKGGEGHAAFRAAIAADITANAIRTSTISRLYLEAAAQGEVSQPLAELAAAIGRGDIDATASAAAAALAVGASSGAAASYGLLLAARTMEPVMAMPKLPVVRHP